MMADMQKSVSGRNEQRYTIVLRAPQPDPLCVEYKYFSACHVSRILLGLLAKIKCSICSY